MPCGTRCRLQHMRSGWVVSVGMCVPVKQAEALPPIATADANHNGIPDGYEFAQTVEFMTAREWRQRSVPMAALLGISIDGFHPLDRVQVTPLIRGQGSRLLGWTAQEGSDWTTPSHLSSCSFTLQAACLFTIVFMMNMLSVVQQSMEWSAAATSLQHVGNTCRCTEVAPEVHACPVTTTHAPNNTRRSLAVAIASQTSCDVRESTRPSWSRPAAMCTTAAGTTASMAAIVSPYPQNYQVFHLCYSPPSALHGVSRFYMVAYSPLSLHTVAAALSCAKQVCQRHPTVHTITVSDQHTALNCSSRRG